MSARLRICLLVSLTVVGWAAFSPAEAQAQRVTVFRQGVSQYFQGGYGGNSYQPQYYGGYSYPQQNYSAYGSGYGTGYGTVYGNSWNGYPSNYSTYGYRSYSYPSYNYSYPSYSYPGTAYRTGYRGSYYGY
jgi:hypothetical protein